MSTPKTITFRTDESTFEKIERLKEILFEDKEVSNSEVLRYAIDSLFNNQNRVTYDDEEIIKLVQSYITVGFFKSVSENKYDLVNFTLLTNILAVVQEAYEEFEIGEIREVGNLYIDDETITIGKLVRFKHRLLPILFLQVMKVDFDSYNDLTDDELADFILSQFADDDFKKGAEKLFGIK